MKNRKGLLKVTALVIAGCLFTLSMHVNAFAEEAVGEQKDDVEMTEEELQEQWKDIQREIYNIGTYEEWQQTTNDNSSDEISTYSVYDVPGTWIQEADGRWWYRHDNGGYTTRDWERINNRWYYFDEQGYMFVGWLNLNGNWYYLDDSGAMQTGWILSNGKYYYCCESGEMLTGWFLTNNKWYYCTEGNGDWVDNTGTQMVQEALRYVGNPYVYGGNSLTNGPDCSGYVKLISEKFGIIVPRTSKAQYASSRKIQPADVQPGDLVFFYGNDGVYHVAFYLGKINYNGTTYYNAIVSAATSQSGICVEQRWSSNVYYGTYWR